MCRSSVDAQAASDTFHRSRTWTRHTMENCVRSASDKLDNKNPIAAYKLLHPATLRTRIASAWAKHLLANWTPTCATDKRGAINQRFHRRLFCGCGMITLMDVAVCRWSCHAQRITGLTMRSPLQCSIELSIGGIGCDKPRTDNLDERNQSSTSSRGCQPSIKYPKSRASVTGTSFRLQTPHASPT